MAGYRTHVSVSGLLGIAYGAAAAYFFGTMFTPVQGALAGVLTWVAGMLPDVDSDSGKPVRGVRLAGGDRSVRHDGALARVGQRSRRGDAPWRWACMRPFVTGARRC
jgi:hypothetical protein